MRILPLAALAAALTAAAPARGETKIGYVDMQRALNEIDEGKAAKARLKAEFDQKQKQLNERQTAFEKARADFEKQSSVLSEQARTDRREELEKSFQDLQVLFQQLQRELSERERDATRGIFDKMFAIVRETAEAEGFTMVLERNDGGVVWAQPALDLTNELVRKYNARHKGGGAPPAAAPAPGAKAPAPAGDPKAAAKAADKKGK